MAPATQFQATTPAVGEVDLRGAWGPQRVGPLLRPQGRGGWSVPLGLSYNSQNWLKDSGGTWKLGDDSGYGFGWRLMAGALIPYWSDPNTLAHYTFIDATGAEYRLEVNSRRASRTPAPVIRH